MMTCHQAEAVKKKVFKLLQANHLLPIFTKKHFENNEIHNYIAAEAGPF